VAEAVDFTVDGLWLGTRRAPAALRLSEGRLSALSEPDPGLPRLPVTLMPGVIDHHVHLGLVDRELLANGPLVEVHDLGWDPEQILAWRADPPRGLTIRAAGPFHTALGGYPSGRSWAPAAAVRAVTDADDARTAVLTAGEAGVDALKIALHTGMPLLSDELLQLLVDSAHAAGLPAIVHAEGPGQAARAVDAGADTLVHTPWSERLSEAELERALATTWISTLAIHEGHDRATAIANLAGFHGRGGRIRYGTDMGNGPNPVGPNPGEMAALTEAGLSLDELLASMTAAGSDFITADRALVCERPLPTAVDELAQWLSDCRRLDPQELETLR
jgi:hypothetical protein